MEPWIEELIEKCLKDEQWLDWLDFSHIELNVLGITFDEFKQLPEERKDELRKANKRKYSQAQIEFNKRYKAIERKREQEKKELEEKKREEEEAEEKRRLLKKYPLDESLVNEVFRRQATRDKFLNSSKEGKIEMWLNLAPDYFREKERLESLRLRYGTEFPFDEKSFDNWYSTSYEFLFEDEFKQPLELLNSKQKEFIWFERYVPLAKEKRRREIDVARSKLINESAIPRIVTEVKKLHWTEVGGNNKKKAIHLNMILMANGYESFDKVPVKGQSTRSKETHEMCYITYDKSYVVEKLADAIKELVPLELPAIQELIEEAYEVAKNKSK